MMKKSILITLLAFGLVTGFLTSTVFAAEQTDQPKSEERAEKDWQQALKTQVALAKAKVALLKARSSLWIDKEKEAALRSLEEANTYLSEAYQNADESTRRRIADLKSQVETAKKAVREKGLEAASELSALADRSEATLNVAIAETQSRAAILKKETSTRMALAQAKAAQLKAKIVLEIDKSPEKVKQALRETERYLAEARASASKRTALEIEKLQSQTQETRKTLTGNTKKAKIKLDTLIAHTEELLQAYGTRVRESEEMGLLRKRYAQLEAQASLLKARLATEKEATYEQAHYYLDEAKVWYARAKCEAKEGVDQRIDAIEKQIDDAKLTVKKKAKEARQGITDLLNRAADIVKKEK